MEPIVAWSSEKVSDWLKGLDAPLQQYPFEEWQLSGQDLLHLSCADLEQLGVHKIGHQELILESVEKLCSLTYGMGGENLRGLTEKLRSVAHSLQMGIQSRWRVNTYDGQGTTKLPSGILHSVLELITAAKGLFSLLNRYMISQLSGYSASRDIITLCRELGMTVNKEITVYEKEKDIISTCRQLVAICDEILSSSPESLLNHTARLESVDLVPVSPGDELGIEITSTGSSAHYVTGTAAESPAEFCEKILAGDEVIQVNDQIVVGWSRANLVRKLKENPNGVTLVLKKVPVSVKRHQSAPEPPVSPEEEEEKSRHSIFERVTASVRSLSFRAAVHPDTKRSMGQEESELVCESVHPGGNHSYHQVAESDDLEGAASRGSPSPGGEASPSPSNLSSRGLEAGRASISSCPEVAGHRDERDPKRSTKGTRTAMSRRRVSCRELGRADCDGWLWKKKKESGVFMAQKWQRFWFVLKGPSLYWYASQQEEKAEGLVQISSYNIESAGEHKRKYVFKMCHQRFQTFIFAAENLNDMSKWVSCLLTAIQKYKKLHKSSPDSEEECYSETEPEDEGSHSPRSHRHKVYGQKSQPHTLPRTKPKKKEASGSTGGPPTTGGSKAAAAPEDEMGMLFNRLKEDGVSLIGHEQPITHAQFRKSFIRRNKNPIINEKVHALRALQSTLKAKEVELQLINKILEDEELNSLKFRQWKEHNEDLYQEIERQALARARRRGKEPAHPGSELPTAETGPMGDGAYGLRLSDGEQLVDADPPSPENNVSSDLGSDLDLSLEDRQSLNSAPPSTDSYFFI
ncbi:connector enhancer of kinase suppressor of ras 1 isoform X2 [Megalops cyprinoides]|uniref:connector enhancer of kinase suppressor of ras 1 isoform X2 n=1 Tax=Megalops cyprinoides TaxID=118141 RepID=UPI001863B7CC|nr:connector enhancer of kinase suppressor of ras 1 isoform X2 [Megalops cyprinoides]